MNQKEKRIYKNQNGHMPVIDFVKMIHNDTLLDYMKGFRTSTHPCPPYTLIDDTIQCFRCMDCHRACKSRVKEYKKHYTAGRKKIMKEELDV